MSEQPPQVGDRKFRNQIVRIAELTVNTSMVSGYEFSNCRIVGPAVFVLLGTTTIGHATWDSEIDALFWEIPPGRGRVIGAVGIKDCVFSSCSFEAIGIAGPHELRNKLERAFRGE